MKDIVNRHTQESPRFVGPATFYRTQYEPNSDNWRDIAIGLAGVPYDGGTTNRPGARHGPRSLREQSTMIAPWNSSTNVNPFAICNTVDIGDVWVKEPFKQERALNEIATFYKVVQATGMVPISVGGDHSVSLPILRALAAQSPIAMVHIDAHCDTAGDYMGSLYHHGAPFSRAVEEGLLNPHKTVQIGIRGPLNSDIWKFSRESGMRVVTMEEWLNRSASEIMREVHAIIGNTPCYLSFDIDALDPAFAPGTGTPVIGGFTSREAIQMVRALRGLHFVGADLVEVSPPFDIGNLTSLVGASLLFEILCIVAESRQLYRGAS